MLAGLWSSLTDLVLPAACAGCGAAGRRLTFDTCPSCVAEVSALRATAVRPTPAPAGLPPCVALGPYDGVLRELLLSYKERGRVGLARPLGALLAEAVATVVEPAEPVRIIYVPDTAAAARARYGDHMSRIARAARLRLREAGHQVIVGTPLVARPKTDSTELGARERLIAAANAFAIRPAELREVRRATGRTLLVDDIITTGGTAAAAALILDQYGVPVSTCVTLAATARRTSRSGGRRA